MTLPRPAVVIFDMDGTTVRHVNPKLLHLLEWLDDMSFKFFRFWGMLLGRGDKAIIYNEYERREGGKRPKLLVHRALHKVRRKPVEQIVEPCPGIYAILNLLKKHGIPAALVSNGLGKGYGHDILQKFQMESLFAATLFREDIKHSKPNPEAILLSLKEMNTNPAAKDSVWYVGDRHKDVSAAQAAQKHLSCRVVPIAYGFNAALAIVEKGFGPEHILMSYYDMYGVLDELLKKAA